MYNFKLKETDLKRLSDFTRSALNSYINGQNRICDRGFIIA
jgi:hypothetical protein